jgi:hypothetical protein
MPRTDLRKVIANFIILIVLVICLISITDSRLFELSPALGQSQKKTITHSKWKNQPVEFVKVKAAGRSIGLKTYFENKDEDKEEFDGDDDWMKGLVFYLKNTSNKNIIYISFTLGFPETDVLGARMGHILTFGHYPEKPNVGSNDKVLKPGEEIEIALKDNEHADLNTFLQSRSFNQVSSVHFNLQSVVFEDDIKWLGGYLMRRDPNNPSEWHTIQ